MTYELFVALITDFSPMAAALKLAPEGTDKFLERIENKDARVLLLLRVTLVHDIEVLVLIERDIMSGQPRIFASENRPVVDDFLLMLTFIKNDRASDTLCDEEVR